jgi:hypothetical protein
MNARTIVLFSALLAVGTAGCLPMGDRDPTPDFTVRNDTEETIEVILDEPGPDDTDHELSPGTSRGFLFGADDFVMDGDKNCDDLDLVARTTDGEVVQRNEGPICSGFVWTIE